MKRAGNLWDRLASFENLLEAAHSAARGKRSRRDVARFVRDLEPNICRLQRELESDTWVPGEYTTFWITDPKPRLISAAPFRDRVVHHALTRVLEPVFEPRFTVRSFASRRGYGQHKALTLAKQACARYEYVLKCDIRKYFPSIDHEILKAALARAVKCGPTLRLAARIIDGSNEQEVSVAYYPGDTLFTPYERRRGLPIGNQTSQFFANVYLNGLDHMVLRQLRPALYLRYVDDFVLFGDDRNELEAMRQAMTELLAGVRLSLHEGKSRVYRCKAGLTFLGWRFQEGRTRLPRAGVVRMARRLRAMARELRNGRTTLGQIRLRVASWLGHAAFGDTWELRRRLFGNNIFGGVGHRANLPQTEHGRKSSGRFVEQQFHERARLEP